MTTTYPELNNILDDCSGLVLRGYLDRPERASLDDLLRIAIAQFRRRPIEAPDVNIRNKSRPTTHFTMVFPNHLSRTAPSALIVKMTENVNRS